MTLTVKRKSTRKYSMESLEKDLLHEIEEFATTMKPLYDNIRVSYTFAGPDEVKSLIPVKAPHYIIISSEKKEGYLTNVGFLFQQMDLFLSSKHLGSCYLGLAKPSEKLDSEIEFVLIIAFGYALGSPHRDKADFKRKPLDKISDKEDKRLEVARLAPSSTNSQPWYFISEGDKIHAYCVKVGLLKALVYNKMNQIDMGIALAHLYISYPDQFSFFLDKESRELPGYYYVGSVLMK